MPPQPVHCRCANIQFPSTQDTHVSRHELTIRYPRLVIWQLDDEASTETEAGDTTRSASGRPSEGGAVERERTGIVKCAVCGEQVGTFVGEVVRAGKENSNTSKPAETSSPLLGLIIPAEPSTFGAPSRPPSPLPPPAYLPPLPDPFFLPPPFTPAHEFFHSLARQAAQHVTESRTRAEEEIAAFVRRKRDDVEREEALTRGGVEHLWRAFERAERTRAAAAGRLGELGHEGRRPGLAASPAGGRKTSFGGVGVRSPDVVSPTGEPSFGGAGSLLGASLSTHGFMAQRPRDSLTTTTTTTTTPTAAAAAAARATSPRQPSAHAKPSFEQNSITMPYQQRKSGIDLDVAASLRVSNMADLYASPATAGGASMHNRPDTRDRRYYDPGADVEDAKAITAERSPSAGKRAKIERVGGQGDIELQPFAESSQVSAASSYQGSPGAVIGQSRSVRGREGDEEEQLRTPRGRAVKPLTDSISPAQLGVPAAGTKAGTGSDSSPATVKSLEKQAVDLAPVGKRVTFEEPAATNRGGPERVAEEQDEEDTPDKAEDAVFDFEEHDTPVDPPEIGIAAQPPVPLEGSTPDADKVEAMRRNTELVENKLIDMMAADAPSHRAAWRNNKDQLWQAIGRYPSRPFSSGAARRAHSGSDVRAGTDGDGGETPSWGTTLLGTSAPIQIQQPAKSTVKYALERKTSLVERPGVLVPALKSAMRAPTTGGSVAARRGSSTSRPVDLPADVVAHDAHNDSGSNTSSDVRRHASVGHAAPEKGNVLVGSVNPAFSLGTSFSMDPGPTLEMDDDDDTDDVPGGLNFVPPHRQTSQDRDPDGMGEAGWRSLA
ncbi:hypothetical protein NliqN6_2700 [Naganishia liquefaciens]|uniref:Uncharacterized protein n=1 Tax=Naganishia liquefaciens TaxID=104408 RepID=A0A8H3TSW8_9TREE|nr:hypothetical protein NliqN6_2700 [Naganishia liquefaciens]